MAGTMQYFERGVLDRQGTQQVGKTLEVKNLYENPEDPQRPWVPTAPPLKDNNKQKKIQGAAILVRHSLLSPAESDHRVSRYYASEIWLQSPLLRDVLEDSLRKQHLAFNTSGMAISLHPHMALFFCRDKVAQLARNHEDPTTRNHCNLLEETIQKHLDRALEAFEVYESRGVVSHLFAWILFPVGKIFALKRIWGNHGALRTTAITWESVGRWTVQADVIKFGGREFGTDNLQVFILRFAGTTALCDMKPYPLVDLSKDMKLREELIRRGKKVLEYQKPVYSQYSPQVDPATLVTYLTDGERLMVDSFMRLNETGIYYKRLPAYDKYSEALEAGNSDMNPSLDPAEPSSESVPPADSSQKISGESEAARGFNRPTAEDIRRNNEVMLEDHDNLVICAPFLYAFSVRRGYWAKVVVEDLLPVKLEADSFNQVIFDEKKKEVLKVLASRFIRSRRPYDDLIPDKGNFFLVLLSGAPGTGKTLMAESLAEHLGRPLLRIMANHRNPLQRNEANQATLSAIAARVAKAATSAATAARLAGKEALMRDEFEAKVQMAADWDGIVLFDEANFVVETNSATIGSNLSVFLRYIEYFQGIVFLTTNVEASQINTAVKSRVHVHYNFSGLSAPMRAKVWRNFIGRTPDALKRLGEEEVARLSKWQMSGRDIKNVFNMARVWCEEQGIEMKPDPIEELIRTVNPLAAKEGEETLEDTLI